MSVVSVLREDPDLAQGLEPDKAVAATRLALARAVRLQKGQFSPHEKLPEKPGTLGMLVVDGMLMRGVAVANRPSLEIFGPGDLVRPFAAEVDVDAAVPVDVRWWALKPARLAVLDGNFIRRMADYPQVIAELMARLSRTSAAGGLRMSIVQQPRLSARLHLMLWHLADNFGRMHSDAVVLPVPLCHGLLSWLVGASRPAVCRAAKELERAGLAAHQPDGSWRLARQPAEGFAELTLGIEPVAS